jgi:hypothetical protein
MKKIAITFFIIIFLSLLYIGNSYSVENNMAPGEVWNNLALFDTKDNKISDLVKACYIKGFREGAVVSVAISDIGDQSLKRMEDFCVFISENNKDILEVMNQLYRDPANKDIEWFSILQIACGQLMGSENIEEALERARQK